MILDAVRSPTGDSTVLEEPTCDSRFVIMIIYPLHPIISTIKTGFEPFIVFFVCQRRCFFHRRLATREGSP